MSGDDYSETVTKLITSRPMKGLIQAPDEPKPTLEYPAPTMQNSPYIQPLPFQQIHYPPSSTPEAVETLPSGSQIDEEGDRPTNSHFAFSAGAHRENSRLFKFTHQYYQERDHAKNSRLFGSVQQGSQLNYGEGELNVARTGKMYATLSENIYSQLEELTTRENYSNQELIDTAIEIADAAELLLTLRKTTDEIVWAGQKAKESAILLNDALKQHNRATELFRESLSLLRSINFEQ
ncbi:uncharacterized protein LOC114915298 isoform X2 [Cajanus cajan]|uniref:uncharacterized protein LOC114915298 isoform X2 n=1 Tax=Cajanus cajan TaxID=3821 RepID=UPI0010FB5D42|nr:uncharacterized protein LOC114915298 isoform X2 [Cajanus cajan]